MAIASGDSVTFHAAETSGMLSWMLRVSRVLSLTCGAGRWSGAVRKDVSKESLLDWPLATPKSRIIRCRHLASKFLSLACTSPIDWSLKLDMLRLTPLRGNPS